MLRDLGSSSSLRQLATSIVTAGVTSGLTSGLTGGLTGGLNLDPGSSASLVETIQYQAARAAVSAATDVALGGDLGSAVTGALTASATQVIGARVSAKIGELARAGDINEAMRYVAPAALGCSVGSLNGGSCGTGAAGAVAGEITAALYFTEERQVAFGSEERAKVDTLVDGRIYEREDVEAAVEAWRQQGVNLAQLAAGLTALAAGAESAGDISGAAAASDNAVENNVCGSGLCVAAALWAAGAAWTAYDTYTTYQEEGGAAAVQQLVTDGVITLVAGPGKAAYKVGGKVYDSGYQAWKAAREAAFTRVAPKIEKQMAKRGWDRSTIDKTIANPSRTVKTRDTRHKPDGGERNNDPATAYINSDGSYVVRNDRTGDIVQISDRVDSGWKSPFD